MSQGTISILEDGVIRKATIPDEGEYLDPVTGVSYGLWGKFRFHTGRGVAMSGWPVFWERLVPVPKEEK